MVEETYTMRYGTVLVVHLIYWLTCAVTNIGMKCRKFLYTTILESPIFKRNRIEISQNRLNTFDFLWDKELLSLFNTV